MSDDPVLQELRAAANNAKVAAEAAQNIAPLPKAVSALSERLATVETALRNADFTAVRTTTEKAVRELNAATEKAADARNEFRAGRVALVGWTALSLFLIGLIVGAITEWSIRVTYFNPPGFCAEAPIATKDSDQNPVTICVVKR